MSTDTPMRACTREQKENSFQLAGEFNTQIHEVCGTSGKALQLQMHLEASGGRVSDAVTSTAVDSDRKGAQERFP